MRWTWTWEQSSKGPILGGWRGVQVNYRWNGKRHLGQGPTFEVHGYHCGRFERQTRNCRVRNLPGDKKIHFQWRDVRSQRLSANNKGLWGRGTEVCFRNRVERV